MRARQTANPVMRTFLRRGFIAPFSGVHPPAISAPIKALTIIASPSFHEYLTLPHTWFSGRNPGLRGRAAGKNLQCNSF
jgi:hypothetical protein